MNFALKIHKIILLLIFHQESAFLVVLGRNRHNKPPPARRAATINVGAGQYVSRSVAITTKNDNF